MINRLVRRLRDERGISLVMALGMLLVMSISVTGAIYYTSTNSRSSSYAKAEHSAVGLAEAGLNNALAAIFESGNAFDLVEDDWLAEPRTTTYPGGTVTWQGTLNEECDAEGKCKLYWLITSTGEVANPTGPNTNDVRRTLTMRINLKPPPVIDEALEIWNWVYTERTGNTCDMTIDQGVTMYAPLYVKGNLCMRSTAKVVTGPMVVGGNLRMSEPQTTVGSQAQPLTEKVRVGGWCRYSNQEAVDPCRAEVSTPKTNVWATDFSNAVSDFNISLPSVWWGGAPPEGPKYPYLPVGHEDDLGWYEMASPGPKSACNRVLSGTPPLFESPGSTVLDSSVPGVFNLTPPGQSYSCVTRRGELTWDHAARKLTVRGVIFIDGQVKIENNSGPIEYVQAPATACKEVPQPGDRCETGSVIYLGGTLLIKNSTVCAVVKGNGCDFDGWEPNLNLVVFAAFSEGGQLRAGRSIEVVSATFQGALYGRYAIQTSTTSTTQGPLVSETEVMLGQTNGADFPPITISPVGMPGFGPEFYTPEEPQIG